MKTGLFTVRIYDTEGTSFGESFEFAVEAMARRVALSLSLVFETPQIDTKATIVVTDRLGYTVFTVESEGSNV